MTSAEQNLANRLDELSPEKRALLALRMKKKQAQGAKSSGIPQLPRQEGVNRFRASFAQERLWILDQFVEVGNPFYNEPYAVRLKGSLDIDALKASVNQIIQRHEILRTTFAVENGQPMQVIHSAMEFELDVIDLQVTPTAQREPEAQRLVIEAARRPFNLTLGPLIAGRLIQLDVDEYILIITMHHIVADHWSVAFFVKELLLFYPAHLAGNAMHPPAPALQYADFAIWQREWLQGDVLEKQLAYWKKQLANAPHILEFPVDKPRPSLPTFQGEQQSLMFPAVLHQALKQYCRQEGVTPFMLLLAAFNVLLFRYTRQRDILVGVPFAGRTRPELDGMIGFFLNTLVFRAQIEPGMTFQELLKQIRQVSSEAQEYQNLPFEKLVDALQVERNISISPLVQVLFNLPSLPMQPPALPGLQFTPTLIDMGVAKHDLTLHVEEFDGELFAFIIFNTDLFHRETIQRMLRQFVLLVTDIVANPAKKIEALNMLTDAEQQQILTEWTNTRTAYPQGQCIHQIFEEQVRQAPNHTALIFENQALSYRQLNERANQLAHHLQKLGVGANMLVGICVERSIEMVVGLLGILKTGAAYVPLDTSYPKPRLDFMLADTKTQFLLTHNQPDADFASQVTHKINLSAQTALSENTENLPCQVTPDFPAYVMYTSGSTGTPKGIIIPHRAVNRLVWNTNYIEIDANDRIAQVSNASFDAATFEIWGALLHGATLVIIPRNVALSPQAFAAELESQRVSILFLTTALFNQIVLTVPGAFRSLRMLLFGGEMVDHHRVRNLLQGQPPRQLLHVYGPTENTTFTSWHLVESVPADAATIPIGKAISNTQIYILDPSMNPTPVGVAGELYVGGDGLSPGYLNRPDITAEKFIPNPFISPTLFAENGQGARLYRTGDLCSFLPDGSIQFWGRIDQQVKIRGLRIELGEIEATLGQHPAVRTSVVVVHQDQNSNKRLVAYFTSDAAPSSADLRDYLKSHLPDYMIPSTFMRLDVIPVTPNGKTDFRALPAPENDLTTSASFVPPQNQLEETIAHIWQEVLGLQVGTQDSFFDVGGNSLLLIQVQTRLQQALQQEIPVVDLFQYATIQGLAQHLSQQTTREPQRTKAEVQPDKLAQGTDRLKLLRQKSQRSAKGMDEE